MYNKEKYQEEKANFRNFVINWCLELSYNNYSLNYIISCYDYFYKYGKRYGLLTEFKENGII